MNGQSLRDLYLSDGPQQFADKCVRLLREGKVRPEDFSLRELWEAVGRPGFGSMRNILEALGSDAPLREEAVNTSVFNVITGELINRKVIEGYESYPAIGDELVTVVSSRRREERFPGLGALDMPVEVKEAEDYPELGGLDEKYVTSTATKKGMIISITEELITEDQTGLVLLRAKQVGERIRRDREKTILNGIQDVNGNVYRPDGQAVALYSAANGNLLTGNSLVDWTDLDAAYAHFINMQDEAGEPMYVEPQVLLVPVSLRGTANRIVNATEFDTGNMTVGNSYSHLKALASPYLDAQSTTTWYIGDFKRQFVWHEVWPVQVLRARQDSDQAFERDIVARFKARYLGGIAALDYRYVIKCTA